MDVDDLLIEQVAFEEQDAVRGRVAVPARRLRVGADDGAARPQRGGGQHPFALAGADDQVCDASRMFLWRDRHFTHASPYGAAGIAHGCAEQFGEGDERHGPWSSISRSRSSKDNSISR